MTILLPFESRDKAFSKDEAFWNNYLKGRPSAPELFFQRIFRYHEQHSGQLQTVHDVGAGNGPYADRLRAEFKHVIVSDISAGNIALAEDRLGTNGFSYRAARVEEADDIPDGSVDMVFATNVMHFCDQQLAMEAVAKQLRSGGTFACAAFGAAQFEEPQIQDIYVRITQSGGRALLNKADDREKFAAVMSRTKGTYNVAPLDRNKFVPGAQRIHLNMEYGGLTSPLPPEICVDEPVHAGLDDVELNENEEGWGFVTDLEGIKEHIASFPFYKEDELDFAEFWREMEEVVANRTVRGHWPAKIVLATRR